jgi:hypothetical protein
MQQLKVHNSLTASTYIMNYEFKKVKMDGKCNKERGNKAVSGKPK